MKKFLGGAAGLAMAAALVAVPVLASDMAPVASLKADGVGEASAKDEGSLKALTFGSWGVDLGARDTSMKPGDDFDRFANGGWFAKTEIPADQASAGVDYDVYNLTQRQLRQVVTGAPGTSQVGGLYQSFTDEARVEALGAKPLMADLAHVAAIKDKAEMARFMGASQGAFGMTIVGGGPYADTDDPTVNVLWLGQAGIGLPERDYYLNDSFKPQRDAYRAYIARTMKMAGNVDPEKAADAIMA
ncbi:MAG TPA: M13 family metallopeptidase N-terminal domain-containing protein, partial [Sphingomicrobium sp.]|nr:M13 family metallopeptidase N-terminal domain-containing protein [Sphingomicrobium sp.]